MEFHEVASIFPLMGNDALADLAFDIQEHGLREPIWTYKGKIIDGRNRHLACQAVGVEPEYREWSGKGSLVAFVVSLNLKRRHLTHDQLKVLGYELEPRFAKEAEERKRAAGKIHGRGQKVVATRPQPISKARDQAAAAVGVSGRSVARIKKLVKDSPKMFAKVRSGEMTLAQATREVEKAERIKLQVQESKAILEGGKGKAVVSCCDYRNWLDDQPTCDLLITDPPYSAAFDVVGAHEDFVDEWLPWALGKIKPTGRAYVCIGAYPLELHKYIQVAYDTSISGGGPELRNVLVWTYRNTLGPSPAYDYKTNWQAILYFRYNNAPKLNCPKMVEQFSVQDINAPDARHGTRRHVWEKPEALAERLIRHSTKPGDMVLDCFAGTGTFLLAAAKLGRIARGCDNDESQIEICKKRGVRVA